MKDKSISAGDIVLVRCIITSEGQAYYKGKDYQENKYLIEKNPGSTGFKVGDDRSFYAYKGGARWFFGGRQILSPLTYEQYKGLIPRNETAGKTLKEIGVKLKAI